MVELTPEERARIYAEEKARMEAREQVVADKKKSPTWKALMVFGILMVLGSPFLPVMAALTNQTPATGSMSLMLFGALLGATLFIVGVVLRFTSKS